jgi:CRISPR-associated protein (TIGR02584 family)
VFGKTHPGTAVPAHINRPESYERRVLLAVTGLSPQIVTETLYALAVKRTPAWIPTEIRLVTTHLGAQVAERALLSDRPGWFHRMREDYGLPEIAFGIENIHVIAGRDEAPLDDIVDDADNRAVADFHHRAGARDHGGSCGEPPCLDRRRT